MAQVQLATKADVAMVPRPLTAADTLDALASGMYLRTSTAHLEADLPGPHRGLLLLYRNGVEGMAYWLLRDTPGQIWTRVRTSDGWQTWQKIV